MTEFGAAPVEARRRRRSRRSRGLGAASLIAFVLNTAAHAAETRIMAKIGGTFDERLQDQTRCRTIAQSAPSEDLPQTGARAGATGYAADLPTAIGGTIAFALIAAIDTSRARGKAAAFCLRNLGYAFIPLTAAEAVDYTQLSAEQRLTWERHFLDQDLAPRISPLLAPAIPALPPYRAEPGTQGGLKVDLASLAVEDGPLAQGATIVSGKLTRWRTAVLAVPFATTEGPIKIAAEAGAIFHQVDYRPQRAELLRDQGATWCGPVQQVSGQGVGAQEPYCFTSQADGYDVFRPTGYVWLAGPYRDGFILPRSSHAIILDERAQDDFEPFDLQIKAAGLSASRVTLEAYAAHSGRTVLLWRRQLSFDAKGGAILPLWSRRALLTRSAQGGLTVSLDEHGDGQGWRVGD